MKQLLASVVAAALLHITPTVVLVKRPDAVQQLLPGADQFLQRDLHLSAPDAHRLHAVLDWSPEDGVLTFYVGKEAGNEVGALEFLRVDTPHGPLEVAASFTPQRTVRGVIVTKCTVETKPWVVEALRAGLTDHYRGINVTDVPAGAAAIKGHVGELPDFMAQEVDKGVGRALVAYRDFYRAVGQ
jgi:hypothetical protein